MTGHLKLPNPRRNPQARRLEDGAESNAGKTGADEVAAGLRRRVGTAGDVLLAALVEEVLDGDSNDGD